MAISTLNRCAKEGTAEGGAVSERRLPPSVGRNSSAPGGSSFACPRKDAEKRAVSRWRPPAHLLDGLGEGEPLRAAGAGDVVHVQRPGVAALRVLDVERQLRGVGRRRTAPALRDEEALSLGPRDAAGSERSLLEEVGAAQLDGDAGREGDAAGEAPGALAAGRVREPALRQRRDVVGARAAEGDRAAGGGQRGDGGGNLLAAVLPGEGERVEHGAPRRRRGRAARRQQQQSQQLHRHYHSPHLHPPQQLAITSRPPRDHGAAAVLPMPAGKDV